MLWFKFVNDIELGLASTAAAFAPYELVVWADLFDTCTHFHADHAPFSSVHDTLLNLIFPAVKPSQSSLFKTQKSHKLLCEGYSLYDLR